MAIPVVPIISAVAPIVLSALDLYRKRSRTRASGVAAGFEEPTTEEGGHPEWASRLRALEDSDLEQARLLRDLSQQVEQLARALEAQVTQQRERERRLQRRFWGSLVVAGLALVLAVVAWVQ
jgi:hypothetical protein